MNSKSMVRTLVALSFATLCVEAYSQASRLVVKTVQPGTAAGLAKKYGLRVMATSVDGKKALLDARSTTNGSIYKYILASDPAVEVVDQNIALNSGGQSGKGSTIPVVGTDSRTLTLNREMTTQINAAPTGGPREVRVAILDTGLDQTSPLWGRVVASRNVINSTQPAFDVATFVDTDVDGKVDESRGHGTMIANLVGEFAPSAKLIVVKTADSDGTSTLWSLVTGIDYAISQGAEIINMSLGSTFETSVLNNLIGTTETAGISLVAAVGNYEANFALFPALNENVIAVAGVNLDETKNTDSNWSVEADVSAPYAGYAEQADGTIGTWSGTSFSSAIVSGAIADALSVTTRKTPANVRYALSVSGADIDVYNSQYAGQVGVRLDAEALKTTLSGL